MRAKILAHFVLLMTLLVAAQMLKEVSTFHQEYPRRVRIVNVVNTNLALVPTQNRTVVTAWLRDASMFFWIVHKDSDGKFRFQAHNGKYLACPDRPQGSGQPARVDSPASVINQKFIRENTTYSGGYIFKCAESPNPHIGVSEVGETSVNVYRSKSGPQFDIWKFRYD